MVVNNYSTVIEVQYFDNSNKILNCFGQAIRSDRAYHTNPASRSGHRRLPPNLVQVRALASVVRPARARDLRPDFFQEHGAWGAKRPAGQEHAELPIRVLRDGALAAERRLLRDWRVFRVFLRKGWGCSGDERYRRVWRIAAVPLVDQERVFPVQRPWVHRHGRRRIIRVDYRRRVSARYFTIFII